jgi:hypothetical protein
VDARIARLESSRRTAWLGLLVGWVLAAGCELVQPEVVVENGLDEPVLITELSFSGCRWRTILAPGDTTAPQRCLPGADRVHFKRFDAQSYLAGVIEDQQEHPQDYPPSDDRIGFRLPTPLWYAYQTRGSFEVDYGEFHVLRVEPNSIEQDFSVPGPYGH